ncbi:MAG: hypothetical protein KDK99_03795 [Verrucomicrobiales bacterium]|nr:hypothetical protein [Verrucomicrobiales bacterium]
MAISKQPVSSFHPGYGCVIMLAAMAIFGGIVFWAGYSLLTQNREIDQFTVAEPAAWPTDAPAAASVEAFQGRLTAFSRAARDGKSAELTLSVADLNTLVALAPDLGNGTYQGMVRFTGTDPEKQTLLADISLPLNTLKFWEGKKRYLVGTAHFHVEELENGPDLRIVEIEVPGKTVPAGFVDTQQVWTWLTPFRTDPVIDATLAAVRSVRVTESGVSLSTTATSP